MNRKNNKVIIASRGSKLALWQANWVKAELENNNSGLQIEIRKIKTTGDKIVDVPLAKVGGKGLFVKEIEEAMLRKDADLAVHSMKDVPTDLPADLHISAVCKREDPRDALITKSDESRVEGYGFKDLPEGATVGTSSLRRSCQILNIRQDLKIVQLRGNLDTRIRKLDEGQFDAIIVAAAGVKRLGMADRITEILGPGITIPAIGQGAIGIECRTDDKYINNLAASLNHSETAVCVRAERAFLKKLQGGCQVPIAAHAQFNSELRNPVKGRCPNGTLRPNPEILVMDGLVGNIAGDVIIRGSVKGPAGRAEKLGIELAEDLLSRGAGQILAEIYNQK